MELNNEIILARIEQKFPQYVVSHETGLDGMLSVETHRDNIIDLLRFLRDDEDLQFNFLTTLCGVHFPENVDRELSVVYHLHNWMKNVRMRVKVFFPITDPFVPSATILWPSANWMERQEYDFFGIHFSGHPDLRRILNVDDILKNILKL